MATKNVTLNSLASRIAESSATITQVLDATQHAHPSFAPSGLRNWDIPNEELQAARMDLIEAAESILHLAYGPSEFLMGTMLTSKFNSFAIAALSEWQVYNAVPLQGTITYKELADKVNVPENRLRRVLHHAINNHIFTAPTVDTVAHTATSAEAADDPYVYGWIEHNFEEVEPGVHKNLESVARFGDSEKKEESGAALALPWNEYGGKYFEWMEKGGEGEPSEEILKGVIVRGDRTRGWRSRRFGHAMHAFMRSGVHAARHVLGGFDWGSLGKGTVVDVGGSKGHISLEIAKVHHDLTIVVQDFESLRGGFDQTIPDDLKPRVSFQAHDFFTPQPTPADVYLVKHVLHDWPDSDAVVVLRNLVSAMKPTTRIVIMEMIMPVVGEGPYVANKMMSTIDLQMMTLFNTKERRKTDWEDLIQRTDERLRINAFRAIPGAAAQMIEVGFKAD